MGLIPKESVAMVHLSEIFLSVNNAPIVKWAEEEYKDSVIAIIYGTITSDIKITDNRKKSVKAFKINRDAFNTAFKNGNCRCLYSYSPKNKTSIHLNDGTADISYEGEFVLSPNPLNNRRYRMYEDGRAYHPEIGICLAKIIEQEPEPPGA